MATKNSSTVKGHKTAKPAASKATKSKPRKSTKAAAKPAKVTVNKAKGKPTAASKNFPPRTIKGGTLH